jgi:hypothetical protein
MRAKRDTPQHTPVPSPAPVAPEMRLTHAHNCPRTPDWDDLWRRLLLGPRRPDDDDPSDTRQHEQQEEEAEP